MYPVLFRIGPVEFYTYGLLVGTAFVVASMLAAKEAERRGINPDHMYSFFIVAFVLGAVFSRGLYVVLNWSQFAGDPVSILNTRSGGMTIHGAILGGVIAALVSSRRMKISTKQLLDIVAAPLPLAQAIGRWGCFFNGCCYGVLTGGAWGVLTRFAPGLRHPVQLYESALDLGLFLVLWRLRVRKFKPGVLFAIYLTGYSAIRFTVEFFRDSAKDLAFGFSQAQVGSIAIAAVAVAFIAANRGSVAQREVTVSETLDGNGTGSPDCEPCNHDK
ncbi:MAG: prolipoprotein diacylglyceryl transferase [Bacillota bacterium]